MAPQRQLLRTVLARWTTCLRDAPAAASCSSSLGAGSQNTSIEQQHRSPLQQQHDKAAAAVGQCRPWQHLELLTRRSSPLQVSGGMLRAGAFEARGGGRQR